LTAFVGFTGKNRTCRSRSIALILRGTCQRSIRLKVGPYSGACLVRRRGLSDSHHSHRL